MHVPLRLFTITTRQGQKALPRNSAAASALIISTSGFGPTWRLTDGNTDDSPKDRLDLYDGKKPGSGSAGCIRAPLRLCPASAGR